MIWRVSAARNDGRSVLPGLGGRTAIPLHALDSRSDFRDKSCAAKTLQPMVFSPFRLDRSTGQLTRDGIPVPLRAKTWALLLYLIERPGVLLTRDELLD